MSDFGICYVHIAEIQDSDAIIVKIKTGVVFIGKMQATSLFSIWWSFRSKQVFRVRNETCSMISDEIQQDLSSESVFYLGSSS